MVQHYGKIMKIYKISQNLQNTQFIPQNPSGPTNPDVNLQNMQNAQAALGPLNDIIQASGAVNDAITELEKVVNVGDLGLKQAVSDKLSQALTNNDNVSLLMHMNLLPNVNTLFNEGEFDKISTKITNDMQSIKGTFGEQGDTGTIVND